MQPQGKDSGTVIALAGWRIDASGAGSIRFPLKAVPLVRQRVADLLRREGARALVCSAACGVDLIALEEAGRLGTRRRVVLPFAPARFRNTSVIDRPRKWGPLFDRVIEDVRSAGDLVVLDLGGDKEAYAAKNEAIVREAQELCRPDARGVACRPIAAVVWEGAARPGDDMTERFRWVVKADGFEERIIETG